MRYIIATLSVLSNFSWAQEPQLTHDPYVNRTYDHVITGFDNLVTSLQQLDEQQIQASNLIDAHTQNKTKMENLSLVLDSLTKTSTNYIAAKSGTLSDEENSSLNIQTIQCLQQLIDRAAELLPANSSNSSLINAVRNSSCSTPQSTVESFSNIQSLIRQVISTFNEVAVQLDTQIADLQNVANMTTLTQKSVANQIDALTLTLASIKDRVSGN